MIDLERLWRRWQYCYWCERETVLVRTNPLPENAATRDHVRSRLSPARAELKDQWRRGIIVLACLRCNQLRNNFEMKFLAAIDPDAFHARGNSRKAEPTLLQAQGRLCNAVLAYLRAGGSLDEETYAAECSNELLWSSRSTT